MRRPEPSATRSPCQSPQHWDLGGPGGSRVVTLYSWPPAPPFLRAFPASPRELQCVRPVDRNDKSTRPPRTPRRPCDRTRRVSNTCTWIMVANCTPIPPRFTPHQKCWAVKITRFSPKVAPHSRMTAQSGDWCRFELSSGRQRADAHARSQSTHIAQALPSLLDAPPPLAQLACATPASALLMAGAACPLPALSGGAHFPPARPPRT